MQGKQKKKEAKPDQASLLLKNIEKQNIEVFMSDKGEGYAKILINNHFEIWPINSRNFKLWVRKIAYLDDRMLPGEDAMKKVLGLVESGAIFGNAQYKLSNRVAKQEKNIYYDLTNSEFQAVKISSGLWSIENNPPIIFERQKHQISQFMPSASNCKAEKVFNYINLKVEQRLLFIVYLISLFIPEIPHPIGIFHGDKGAAKTSVTKAIKKVIDPSIVETTNMPKEQIDMIQQLNNNYLIAYDNLSTLQEWQSDLLCRAVTGEGSAKRKLFTDSDDILFSFRRCVILNGINIVATRADLLDRALLFELERITEEMRLEETQLWENFNADLPEILGGMFNIISKAIPIYSTSKLKKLHRLADFTHWGYAIAEAMKQGEGDVFLKDYEENLKEQNVEVINSHPLAKVILEFMKNQNEWEGTIESLLVHLKERATEIGIDTKSKAFPTASNYLSNQLNRLKSNLEAEGIYYTKGGRKCYGIPCRLSKTKPAIEPIPEQVELLRPWEKQCSLSVDDM